MTQAVLLASHGSIDDLNDLAAFVSTVRRGHPAPDDLVAELRRRYEAVGGSPLNAVNEAVARKLEKRVGFPVEWASRLWKPYVRDVLQKLARRGVDRVAFVPLAQHSAAVYAAAARPLAEEARIELACASNWGRSEALSRAFADRVLAAVGSEASSEPTTVVMTAHSLPRSVIDAGDPYEREVRASAAAIAELVVSRTQWNVRFEVAFQSQGLAGASGANPWLGPDIPTTLDAAKARGDRRVVFAPIGFLADHVEVLYDLDVEARALAADRGLAYARARSLNSDDDFIEVLAGVSLPLLLHG
jgi:protoporphyrin/coproporphyrin ferrochelatase